MPLLAVSLAVAAAALNAGAAVMQRLATGQPTAGELFSRQFAASVWRNRQFLGGIGLQVLAFFAQAAALARGSLVIVEPLLTADLVFLLLFIYIGVGVRPGIREWLAVAAICAGLSGLFVAAKPAGGTVSYTLLPWLLLTLVIAVIIGITTILVRHLQTPRNRALLAGTAASCAFALNAAFTKLALNQLSEHGVAYVLSSWPVYALLASGLTSLFLMQNAYGAGPLADSQPSLEITEPVISVIIGIVIFGDTVSTSPAATAVELVGAGILAWGVIGLAGSARIQQAGQRGL